METPLYKQTQSPQNDEQRILKKQNPIACNIKAIEKWELMEWTTQGLETAGRSQAPLLSLCPPRPGGLPSLPGTCNPADSVLRQIPPGPAGPQRKKKEIGLGKRKFADPQIQESFFGNHLKMAAMCQTGRE